MNPIISISVFTAYLILITVKFGILPSISQSAYEFKSSAWFTLGMWAVALPIVLSAESGFLFLSGAAMMFTGAAAMFKEPMTKTVHYIFAFIIILSGHAHLAFDFGLWEVAAGSLALSVPLLFVRNRLFWIEVLNAYVILISLILSEI